MKKGGVTVHVMPRAHDRIAALVDDAVGTVECRRYGSSRDNGGQRTMARPANKEKAGQGTCGGPHHILNTTLPLQCDTKPGENCSSQERGRPSSRMAWVHTSLQNGVQ
jgi:hypothetical protein